MNSFLVVPLPRTVAAHTMLPRPSTAYCNTLTVRTVQCSGTQYLEAVHRLAAHHLELDGPRHHRVLGGQPYLTQLQSALSPRL